MSKLVLMGAVGVPFEITEDLAKMRLAAATPPGVHEAYSSMFPAPRQDSVEAMTVPDQDIRALTQPTLIIHGRDDEVIPLSNSMRLNELIEQSQLHVYGQCGHWVQIEHTADFTQLVGNFLTT